MNGRRLASGCRIEARPARGDPAADAGLGIAAGLRRVCAFGADPQALTAKASLLDQLLADGVARRSGAVIALADDARPLVRVLAAAFDQYLGQGQGRHSRTV